MRTSELAYDNNCAAIQKAIKTLQKELRLHRKRQRAKPQDWGFAGDTSYILDLLFQALKFLGAENQR